MTEEQQEEVLSAFEAVAHFLKGATFDHRIPKDVREAMSKKADDMYALVELYV